MRDGLRLSALKCVLLVDDEDDLDAERGCSLNNRTKELTRWPHFFFFVSDHPPAGQGAATRPSLLAFLALHLSSLSHSQVL